VVGPWFSALEDKLQLDWSSFKFTFKGSSYTCKGAIYQGILDEFNDPVVGEIDFSRFDATLNVPLSSSTEMVAFAVLLGEAPPEFWDALSYQLKTAKCTTVGGTKYYTVGNRFSGEYNTSLGNCFINYLCMAFVMWASGISKWRCLVEGDDNVVMMEEDDWKFVKWDLYEAMGLKIELQKKTPDTAEFCSGWFMRTNGSRQFVRLAKSVLTKTPWSLGCPSKRLVPAYLRSVALCEQHSSAGVPVLAAYARYLERCSRQMVSSGPRFDKDTWFRYLQVQHTESRPVDAEAYEHFALFHGIPVDQLKECEKYLDGCTVDVQVLDHPVLQALVA